MKSPNWYGWVLDSWDSIRSSYWFFPVLMALFAGICALSLIELDRSSWAESIHGVPWISTVSAESARVVLSTVAGSMMTVTGVVFSITVVALTLASSQFGPRLLRTFFRDRGSQFALGTFLSTFFFSLLVLRAVETPERVPVLSTAIAVLLAVFSLFVLIYFVHHVAASLQASRVIASVAAELDAQLPGLFPSEIGQESERPISSEDAIRRKRVEEEGILVRAKTDGYVRVVDEVALITLSCEHDLLICLCTRPGRFVASGQALLRVWGPQKIEESSLDQLRETCLIGMERTPVQDFRFSTGQLAEMAVRALSPGINDPNTAIECIHRLGAVVTRLTRLEMPAALRFDDQERLRVVADPPAYEDYVSSCFDPIRQYGAHDPRVARALLEAIGRAVENCTSPVRLRVLEEHARDVLAGHARQNSGAAKRDFMSVRAAYERVMNPPHPRLAPPDPHAPTTPTDPAEAAWSESQERAR